MSEETQKTERQEGAEEAVVSATPEETPEATPEATPGAQATPAEAVAPKTKVAPAGIVKAPEVKGEKATEAPATEEVAVPAKFASIVEAIEKMSVLDLNELVGIFEKKFGVSATAVAASGAGAGEAAEEKTEFDVTLVSDGGQKIPVMKVVKELLGLGLKEAKDLVEGLPASVKTGIKKEEAEAIKAKIEAVGGKVEIK